MAKNERGASKSARFNDDDDSPGLKSLSDFLNGKKAIDANKDPYYPDYP